MILGFSTKTPWGTPTNFVEKILAGVKTQTIREDKSNRWERNIPIQFATGVRTKQYNQFADGVCMGIVNVRIKYPFVWVEELVWVDEKGGIYTSKQMNKMGIGWTAEGYKPKGVWRLVDKQELCQFARSDGFDNVADFWKWFNEPFLGKVIKFQVNKNS